MYNQLPQKSSTALFQMGFRPFFLGASLFAILSMLIWTAIYSFQIPIPLYFLPASVWHGHEMIFGYGMAVIAGFLLTAIGNWTGIPTIKGGKLALLFLLWGLARVLPLTGTASPIALTAAFDLAFLLGLTIAAAIPIIKARSSNNYSIVAKLILILLSNVAFYLGVFQILDNGIYLGLYSGLYMILAVVLTIGRRVLPFFIERATNGRESLKNWRWLDLASLVFFLLFWLSELVQPYSSWVTIFSAILFALHSIRLAGWYSAEIWTKPLLWVLYLAYTLLTLAFALKAATGIFSLNPFLALHAFGLSGVGIMTLGMMARISLGHTGRDVYNPPKILGLIFSLLLISAICRILLPLLEFNYYPVWVLLSQSLWITAFALFTWAYAPMLATVRIDNKPG